jgi:hypothetical protein
VSGIAELNLVSLGKFDLVKSSIAKGEEADGLRKEIVSRTILNSPREALMSGPSHKTEEDRTEERREEGAPPLSKPYTPWQHNNCRWDLQL